MAVPEKRGCGPTNVGSASREWRMGRFRQKSLAVPELSGARGLDGRNPWQCQSWMASAAVPPGSASPNSIGISPIRRCVPEDSIDNGKTCFLPSGSTWTVRCTRARTRPRGQRRRPQNLREHLNVLAFERARQRKSSFDAERYPFLDREAKKHIISVLITSGEGFSRPL